MNKINKILTWSTVAVLVVTIERFSFTTKVLLQPYGFIRLHEVVQMCLIIFATVVIPFFQLREITNNFEAVRSKSGWIWALVFISGVYFYATGNGVPEVSSFNFNNFCDTKNFGGDLCGGFFVNDLLYGQYFVLH